MFDISTCPLADVELQLRSVFAPDQFCVIEQVFEPGAPPPPSNRPFVQLGYEDVDAAFLDLAFGYADIAGTNGPIGLAGSFPPLHHNKDIVVFPVSGLETHLEAELGTLVAALRAEGEPTRFLSAAHQYRSVQELLIAGLLACILFARQYHQALRVRW